MEKYPELRSAYGLLHEALKSLLNIRTFYNLPYFDAWIMFHDGTGACYSLAVENLLMMSVLKHYTLYRNTERARYIRVSF